MTGELLLSQDETDKNMLPDDRLTRLDVDDVDSADAPDAMKGQGTSIAKRGILNEVCTPWCIYVIGNLDSGPKRFTEIKRAVCGISQRMLAVSLRTLERDGLVQRTVDAGKPVKVIYSLTSVGKTFAEPARAMIDWAARYQQSIAALPGALDER